MIERQRIYLDVWHISCGMDERPEEG